MSIKPFAPGFRIEPAARGAWAGRTVVSALVIVVLAMAAAFGLRLGENARLYPAPAGEGRPAFLINNGFHSDIALPTAEVLAQGGPLADAVRIERPRPWTVVGWGDARFYTGSGFSAARVVDGLRALFWPGNPSVVRVEELQRAPDQVYAPSAVTPITLSPLGMDRLIRRAGSSFRTDGRGGPVRSTLLSDDHSAGFFVSREHFSVLHLCNHWAAGLLSSAGVPTHPILDSLPWGLKRDLRSAVASASSAHRAK